MTWTNTGSKRARVRDLDHNLLDTDDIQPGQSASFTFCTARTVQIGDHRGSAWATIIVGSSSNPSPSPSPSPSPNPSPSPSPSPGASPSPSPSPSPTPPAPSNNIIQVVSIERTASGKLLMQGYGVPGRMHSFEAKSDITGQFETVGFATADANGLVVYETTGSSLDLNFYRFTVQ